MLDPNIRRTEGPRRNISLYIRGEAPTFSPIYDSPEECCDASGYRFTDEGRHSIGRHNRRKQTSLSSSKLPLVLSREALLRYGNKEASKLIEYSPCVDMMFVC